MFLMKYRHQKLLPQSCKHHVGTWMTTLLTQPTVTDHTHNTYHDPC